MEDQDRSRWDHALIAEGLASLDDALAVRRSGPYQVQAAIAACHATAPDANSTDWRQIAALCAELTRLVPSPVVDLNRAVAIAMARARRPARSTATTCCPQPGTAASPRPPRPTKKRWNWRRTPPPDGRLRSL
jgi:predicted RNA polymerase sigma factor